MKLAPLPTFPESDFGAHLNMGDVLPPKRQTVVERLKRRLELYRRHQDDCLPRYEQSARGIYENQRQDTLILKQRFLESKAKKAKTKNEHRNYKDTTSDAGKSQLHTKHLKRPADEPPHNPGAEGLEDIGKPNKIPRTEQNLDQISADSSGKQTVLPKFSVQIVQQFSQQNSQTIQTNVTVQTALGNNNNSSIKCSNPSELQIQGVTKGLEDRVTPTSRKVEIECKQEKTDLDQNSFCQFQNQGKAQFQNQPDLCQFQNKSQTSLFQTKPDNSFSAKHSPDLFQNKSQSDRCQFQNNLDQCHFPNNKGHTDVFQNKSTDISQFSGKSDLFSNKSADLSPYASKSDLFPTKSSDLSAFSSKSDLFPGKSSDLFPTTSQASNSSAGSGDRLSDSFPNIEFGDDSDILQDPVLQGLIDDVMSSDGVMPSDIMKDFNFDDSIGSVKESDELSKEVVELAKDSIQGFQDDRLAFQSSSQGIFRSTSSGSETPLGNMSPMTSTPVTSANSFFSGNSQQRLSQYPNMSSASMSMDFKLNEPNPAALTLKQMAEQHQNMEMQHKQQTQQQQLASSPLASRSFNQDTFFNQGPSVTYISGSPTQIIQGNQNKIPANNMFTFQDRRMSPRFTATDSMSHQTNMPNLNPRYPGVEPIFQQHDPKASVMVPMKEKQRQMQMGTCGIEQGKPPAYPPPQYAESARARTDQQQFQRFTRLDLQQTGQPQQRIIQIPQDQQTMHVLQHTQQHPTLFPTSAPQRLNFRSVNIPQTIQYLPQAQPQYSPLGRPPPEYKPPVQPQNPTLMYINTKSTPATKLHRPPNVTITPDGSMLHGSIVTNEWKPPAPTYRGFEGFDVQAVYPQYRSPVPQQPRIRAPVNNHMMGQPQQRPVMVPGQSQPVRSASSPMLVMDRSMSISPSISPLFGNSQQDGNQISFDFLDNFESSASSLLKNSQQEFLSLDDLPI